MIEQTESSEKQVKEKVIYQKQLDVKFLIAFFNLNKDKVDKNSTQKTKSKIYIKKEAIQPLNNSSNLDFKKTLDELNSPNNLKIHRLSDKIKIAKPYSYNKISIRERFDRELNLLNIEAERNDRLLNLRRISSERTDKETIQLKKELVEKSKSVKELIEFFESNNCK